MKIADKERSRLVQVVSQLAADRYSFWTLWRDLANYFLPKRYVWLQSDKERRVREARNPYILDATGTRAGRILASGLMNGITSPSRPWFKLTIPGFDDEGGPVTAWLEACTRVMQGVLAQSNFYNATAVMYLDLVFFGTAATLIYEDEDSVIRCFNPALGEYYLGQNANLAVNMFAREYTQTVLQLVERFGIENVSAEVKSSYNRGGSEMLRSVDCVHLIEPNVDQDKAVPALFPFRETYWEKGMPQGLALSQRGFHELPGIFPRWELTANDSYGTSPAMDALGDVIQLQQETKRKAQGLDKAINPPVVADIQLQHRPTALLPNGITYVAGVNSVGVKSLYDSYNPPIQEMTADIRDVRMRIQENFHNDLFQMISQLETVRSATEIDARREEKLILLGPVLERFENEALDPAIERVFNICNRRKLLPPAPPELADVTIEIEYVSILSQAQRALAATPVERWVSFVGNLAAVNPSVLNIPNWDELVRNYGVSIGVEARNMNPREVVEQMNAEEKERIAQERAMSAAGTVAQGAKTLSETDVGGGASALQQLLAQGVS